MSRYQIVTLALALGVTACLVGIGIAIGERSLPGVIGCILGTVLLMGAGFSYKRKHQR